MEEHSEEEEEEARLYLARMHEDFIKEEERREMRCTDDAGQSQWRSGLKLTPEAIFVLKQLVTAFSGGPSQAMNCES